MHKNNLLLDFLSPNMSVILNGTLGDIHPSVRNDWFVDGAKWFDVDVMDLNKKLKDIFKNYKNILILSILICNYR